MASVTALIQRLRALSPVVRRSTVERLQQEVAMLGGDTPAGRHLLDSRQEPSIAPFFDFAPPGHFYSPIPPLAEAAAHVRSIHADPPASIPGIDSRLEAQLGLAAELAPLIADFHPSPTAGTDRRYFTENPAFGQGDAQVLQAILRHLRPKRIVEIGSGFSSLLVLDVADEHLGGDVEITLIEPYDELLRSLLRPDDLERVELVTAPIQEVDTARFEDLEGGDVVFIDSTHVVRAGSDVNRDVFEILPRLRPGVAVHFHDLFYPFEYPEEWIREGRAWSEAYLLRAFLAYNEAFEIMLFPHQLQVTAADRLEVLWPSVAEVGIGASLWLQRTA